LPDINGLQILQNIRQNPATKNIVVVLLTNLGQDAVIKQGFELGADGYLVKAAYTPDQIVQEVKNIIAKKQAQHAQATPTSQPSQTPAPIPAQTPPVEPVK
ncbi:MAG: response regulator, partial [Candidatus Daviesbacteria bacterium]|nr:response regulator [Candidatus Daviesbacteria bacterium]